MELLLFCEVPRIKCPQCTEIVIVGAALREEINWVVGCNEVKEEMKKAKMAGVKAVLGAKATGKTLCQICVASMSRDPKAAQFQCLTCKNLLLCQMCRGKHKRAHKIVSYLTPDEEDQIRSATGEILTGIRSNCLVCQYHKFNVYTRFCYTCNTTVCEKCAVLDPNEQQAKMEEAKEKWQQEKQEKEEDKSQRSDLLSKRSD